MCPDQVWPGHWPRTARDIAAATVDAVEAAHGTRRGACGEALDRLAELPADQVVATHSGIVRELLEAAHPDGLSTENAQDVLRRCAGAVSWFPDLDVGALGTVLTGALGLGDPDESVAPQRGGVLAASVVVIADLAAAAQVPVAAATRRAVDEIARAETVEMP
ncbi:hypothetical protein SAMN05444695_10814 [Rhodococcus triatomae]|uniref:Uncharacterized protein n=1 Tax=Rhodococcus triatomae TaxID=300028 RepID=A0A1G8KZH2_9NOCA|nr:hypothetical protein [Rhodococcus triatomae]SDI48868.1 hypothetical protein SAMN05444695_10814 [Rhodococcus triatomae]